MSAVLKIPLADEAAFPVLEDVDTEPFSDWPTLPLDPPMPHSLASGVESGAFAFPRSIADFHAEWIPPPSQPDDYNDDIFRSSFCPSSMTWAGERRRKGAQFNIPDAVSHTDHVERAMSEPFHLSGLVPLPRGLSSAMDCIRSAPDVPVLVFWKELLRRMRRLRADCSLAQAAWVAAAPAGIPATSAVVQPPLMVHLLAQLGAGGSRWMKQFIYGFGAMGSFSQAGVFPTAQPSVPQSSLFGTGWGHVPFRSAG